MQGTLLATEVWEPVVWAASTPWHWLMYAVNAIAGQWQRNGGKKMEEEGEKTSKMKRELHCPRQGLSNTMKKLQMT